MRQLLAGSVRDGELDGLTDAEQQRMGKFKRYDEEMSGYIAIQSTRPQTLAYGLKDSPCQPVPIHA